MRYYIAQAIVKHRSRISKQISFRIEFPLVWRLGYER